MESAREFVENWLRHGGVAWWDKLFMWLAWLFVITGSGMVIVKYWNHLGDGIVPILLAGIAVMALLREAFGVDLPNPLF